MSLLGGLSPPWPSPSFRSRAIRRRLAPPCHFAAVGDCLSPLLAAALRLASLRRHLIALPSPLAAPARCAFSPSHHWLNPPAQRRPASAISRCEGDCRMRLTQ